MLFSFHHNREHFLNILILGSNAMGEVGTTKLFENEKVIIWEFILEPGEETAMHKHEHDYVFYALEGAPLQVHDAEGNDLGTLPVATGDTYAFRVEKGELISTDAKNLRVPTLHKAKNTGTSRYREILVESK
tara:strand:+ start:269 stop:664 length:396 start_codon:yes stop_codon:yes gene_type:complete